jgi:hypothetical protein
MALFPLALLRRSGYAKAKGEIRKGVKINKENKYPNPLYTYFL